MTDADHDVDVDVDADCSLRGISYPSLGTGFERKDKARGSRRDEREMKTGRPDREVKD